MCPCGNPVASGRRRYCSDVCRVHHQYRRAAQKPVVESAGRTCRKCDQWQEAAAFNADRRYESGLQPWCKPCYREYRAGRRAHQRRLERLSKYGISIKDQIDLIANQAYRCAACRVPITEESAHLDHCHTTGRVRGFLCQPCNVVIGLAGENQGRLIECAAYLARQNEMTPVRLVSEVSYS